MKIKELKLEIKVTENIQATCEKNILVVKGEKGEVKKNLNKS